MPDDPASTARATDPPDAPSHPLRDELTDDVDVAPRDATPSVLAVVVAHEPGDWFEDTLESLATQDYPRVSVLVVDGVGEAGLTDRVRAVVPDASVLDASDTEGFSAAANAVLETDLDPAFVLICHDDVALAPDAVRLLVTESLRSNAGVAGPKLVDWARPDRLQHVGYVVDRFAVADDVVGPDELDQEQYDAVADVFAVPSACVLVRTDLFQQLDGFDSVIVWRGEDVDLCWRAHLAGARVLVVPDAVVRHREAMIDRTGVDDIRKRRARHQLRTVLVTSSLPSLFVTVPLALVLSAGEALIALVTGRFSQVGHVVSAWTWNLRRLGGILRRRRRLREVAKVRPREIRALQQSGSVRINAFVSGQIGRGDGIGGASREFVSAMRTGTARIAVASWVIILAYLVFGSRSLFSDGIPAVGDFAAHPTRAGDLLADWWNGWRDRDLGAAGTIPTGTALLGGLGWLTGGATGMVRTLSILLPVVVGLVGAWRLPAVTGSRRAQLGSLAFYLLVPLPWAALAGASAAGLVAYAAAPFLLAGLLRAQANAPFRRSDGPVRPLSRATLGAGVAVGVAAFFEPGVVVVVPIVVVGLVVGGVLAARPSGTVRLLVATVGLVLVAAVMAAPFLVDLATTDPGWEVLADGRDGDVRSATFSNILRFEVGPTDRGPLVWLLAVPLALPLLVGRSWRFELAVRCWSVALAGWGAALAVTWGVVPFGLPDLTVLLAPAAAALAGAAGAAVSSVEHDFRGARFGWRQALVPMAVGASVVAAVPAVPALESGRWEVPRGDFAAALPLADADVDGSYRVLWIADPEFLPVVGRSLPGGMAWATTLDGAGLLGDRHLPADAGDAHLVEVAVQQAVEGDTARLGRVLAGLGIRYVVLLERLAPAPFSEPEHAVEVPAVYVDAFADQLDLRRIEGVNSAAQVYDNTVWASVRAAVATGFDDGVDDVFDLELRPITGSAGILAGRGASIDGRVPAESEVLVTQSPAAGWRLEVDGEAVPRRESLGWASVYLPAGGGEATFSYDAPWWRDTVLVAQLVVLGLATVLWLRRLLGRGARR